MGRQITPLLILLSEGEDMYIFYTDNNLQHQERIYMTVLNSCQKPFLLHISFQFYSCFCKVDPDFGHSQSGRSSLR